MCCCCLPRKCVFCLRLRTGCLVIACAELGVHGIVMCYLATRVRIYGSLQETAVAEEGDGSEGSGEEEEDSAPKLTKYVVLVNTAYS